MFKANPDKSPSSLQKLISGSKEDTSSPTSPNSNGKSNKDVRFDGGILLGNTDFVAYQPHELATILDELLAENKWNSARSLIGLYPDIVVKIMMNEGGSSLSKQRQLDIAKLLDEKWSGDQTEQWQAFVRSIGRDKSVDEFLKSRSTFLELIGNNDPRAALELDLSKNLNRSSSAITLATAEALRLEGIALLMLEDFQESVLRFDKAFSKLRSSHPYQACQIGLLLGETQRHAKQLKAWKSTWEISIDIQSRWLSEKGLSDPAFWKKAAFLRPVSSEWPDATISRLENSLRNESLDFGSDQTKNSEAVIWATIGIQRLKRHESQNAILAFKKSEALVVNKTLKSELQMQQALAMIDGGQPGPASAILLRLSSNSTSLIGDRSKAILATLKLQNGSLAQGMNLLQSAISTCRQWPESERLRAQADYGLSYLMRGREKQGISLLNHVYDQFVERKEFDQANQCLWNIANYYEKTEQTAKYRSAKAKLQEMESY